jgi:hypothetical protein
MLVGAGVFLGAKRLRAESADGLRPASGAKETSLNLAIAGATFLLGALATSWALRRLITPDMLGFWILAGVGIVGALALVAGAAAGYLISFVMGVR